MTKQSTTVFNKIITQAPKYLSYLTIVLSFSAIVLLSVAGVLPLLWAIILTVFGGIGLWLTISPLLKKNQPKGKVVTLSIVAVFISLISITLISFAISLISFLNTIQEDEYSTETYSIIAKRDRTMTAQLAKTAGMVQTDPYSEAAKKELPNHTGAKPVDFPTATAAMEALTNKNIDVSVFNSANTQLTKESDDTFDKNFEIIATFTVQVKRTTEKAPAADASKPFAIYISGIDTYGGISTVSRSDVNMLAIANPKTQQLLLINTPRDYYVQLHGTTGTKDKLTHAGIYGVDMSRKTLEDLYQIEIPYYVRVNFSSLVSIVDTLGGIEVYSDYDFKSFRTGYNTLNGKQALEFSRERYSFSEGDRQRGRNQQRVIEAIVAKMSTPGALVNYQSLLGSVGGAVQTNIPPAFITSLASSQVQSGKRWSTKSISVDGAGSMGPTYSMGAQQLYIMIPDQTSLQAARDAAAAQLK